MAVFRVRSAARVVSMAVVLFSVGLGVRGADDAASAPAAASPLPLKFYLMDGSELSGTPSIGDLAVDTPFGALTIPLGQIKSFTPGLNSHPDFDKHLTELVNDLAADGFAEREKAQAALSKMGPEIRGELQRQLKTAEAEKQTRLQKILDDFDAMSDSDQDADAAQGWTREDVVVTNSFTVVGHIATPAFAVASPYGTLQVKIGDIRRASRGSEEPEEVRKGVTVPGTVINQKSFTSSGIRVNRGDVVTVAATGSINMTPWGNVASTPDGGQNFGVVQPGNIFGGTLIARIGNEASVKVGSKGSFTADKTGILEFGIAVPGDYSGFQFPGEYQVKVRVQRK